jgi:peptide/nickel transport system ATP-binding protein
MTDGTVMAGAGRPSTSLLPAATEDVDGRIKSGHDEGVLVSVDDLTVRFVTRETTVYAVNGVSFTVRPGEVLCILGESGSGKSVTLRAMMRLLPRRARIDGSIRIDGNDVLALGKRGLRELRGGLVSMIFQEPMTALDPVYTIGTQITETIRRHKGGSRAEARSRALELLELVKIPEAERRLDNYPHELSGGLRQRAMIAMALSCGPRLLLADEPTTALDATVQIQVLILLRKLQRELGMGTIFVTHDLGVAAEIADRIAVMYAGRIVEEGPVAQVLNAPMHPYTQGLLASTVHGQSRDADIQAIPGSPPDLRRLPSGCAFAPRCVQAIADCRAAPPAPSYPSRGRMVRCLRLASAAMAAE